MLLPGICSPLSITNSRDQSFKRYARVLLITNNISDRKKGVVAQIRFQFCLWKSFKAESIVTHPTKFPWRQLKDAGLEKQHASQEVQTQACVPKQTHTHLELLQRENEEQMQGHSAGRERSRLFLTDEEVPFGIQVRLVGKATPHDIVTVVVAGFEPGQAAAVRAVQHPG